jgi:hypothetical protein
VIEDFVLGLKRVKGDAAIGHPVAVALVTVMFQERFHLLVKSGHGGGVGCARLGTGEAENDRPGYKWQFGEKAHGLFCGGDGLLPHFLERR